MLEELLSIRLNYKGIPVNIFGIPKFSDYKKRSVRSSLQRLHKNGLVENKGGGVVITESGTKYLFNKNKKNFDFIFPTKSIKNLLLIFDIPDVRRADRDWLRFQLKKFDYIMVQRSVWVGPSPLPEEFLGYLKDIKLKNCIKMFKLAKGYTK